LQSDDIRSGFEDLKTRNELMIRCTSGLHEEDGILSAFLLPGILVVLAARASADDVAAYRGP
jgi:hypothetical protein